jgi:hypothetical protein
MLILESRPFPGCARMVSHSSLAVRRTLDGTFTADQFVAVCAG